jgi:putative NADH-flavin reductase
VSAAMTPSTVSVAVGAWRSPSPARSRSCATPTAVDWSYASPPPVHLVEGERTGRYRVRAGDLPITDAQGESRITIPDYAVAIVDTLESDRFVGARFTAAY